MECLRKRRRQNSLPKTPNGHWTRVRRCEKESRTHASTVQGNDKVVSAIRSFLDVSQHKDSSETNLWSQFQARLTWNNGEVCPNSNRTNTKPLMWAVEMNRPRGCFLLGEFFNGLNVLHWQNHQKVLYFFVKVLISFDSSLKIFKGKIEDETSAKL